MRTILAAFVTAAVMATALPAGSKEILGVKRVAYGSETDVIQVAGPKRYKSIRVCVHDHAVRFRDLDVVYANGGCDDVTVRAVVPMGECTRWIDLRGQKRNIRRIVLRYDTFGNSGPRAKVTVWGR